MTQRNLKYGCIYFVHAPELGRTKIGWTIRSPHYRMTCLQTGSPCHLSLDGLLPARKSLERYFHKMFRKYQHHLEWFNDNDLLDTYRTHLSYPANAEIDANYRIYEQIIDRYSRVKAIENLIPMPLDGLQHCMIRCWHEHVKPQLTKIVGWHAEHQIEELKTSGIYDTVYDALWHMMPLCKCCNDKRDTFQQPQGQEVSIAR